MKRSNCFPISGVQAYLLYKSKYTIVKICSSWNEKEVANIGSSEVSSQWFDLGDFYLVLQDKDLTELKPFYRKTNLLTLGLAFSLLSGINLFLYVVMNNLNSLILLPSVGLMWLACSFYVSMTENVKETNRVLNNILSKYGINYF